MKRLFTVVVIATLFILSIWPLMVPEALISGLISKSVSGGNLSIDISGLKKGFFFDISSERVSFSKSGKTLLSIDNFEAKINPLSLFLLRLTTHIKGNIGSGEIIGRADIFINKNLVNIKLNNADISNIPLFASIGIQGNGSISGELTMTNRSGVARFNITDADIKDSNIKGASLPLHAFQRAQGALSFSPDIFTITSFSIEGDGIYARLKGDIRGNKTDLTMEIMPEKSFRENNSLLLLLGNYKVTEGYYAIPFIGALNFD